MHDLVKPRRHLLVEPNVKEYLPFLQPLLDRPNSSYQHLQWDPLDLNTYERLFDEGHLPEQGVGKVKDRKGRCGMNNTLLVLANLTHRRLKKTAGTNTPHGFMFGQYLKACFDQSLFHRYGLVRIIATLPVEDSEVVLPHIISHRKKAAVLAEATALSLQEVAGGDMGWTTVKEWAMLKTSADRVNMETKNMGIEVAEGRELKEIHAAPFPVNAKPKDPPGVLRPRHDWHDELIEAEAEIERGDVKMVGQGKSTKKKPPATPEEAEKQAAILKKQKTFSILRSRISRENREFYSTQQLVDLQEEIDELELAVAIELAANPDAKSELVESQRAKISKLKADLETYLDSASATSRKRATLFTDDRRIYNNGGKDSLLLWEQRQCEPLRIDAEEIYPLNTCSIVDFQPDPNAPLLSSTDPEKMRDETEDTDEFPSTFRIFLHLLGQLTSSGIKTVPELLDTMFSGRPMEEIVRAVPSLVSIARATPPTPEPAAKSKASSTEIKTTTVPVLKPPRTVETRNPEDPSTYDLSQTRIRTIPATVFWDLAMEWERWPFRPESEREIINLLGGKLSQSDNLRE